MNSISGQDYAIPKVMMGVTIVTANPSCCPGLSFKLVISKNDVLGFRVGDWRHCCDG